MTIWKLSALSALAALLPHVSSAARSHVGAEVARVYISEINGHWLVGYAACNTCAVKRFPLAERAVIRVDGKQATPERARLAQGNPAYVVVNRQTGQMVTLLLSRN